MALMQRVLRRSLSQQAVVAAGRHSSGSSQNAVRSLEFQGRSFLLPTLTLVRGAGAAAMKTARAHKTPIVLDMQLVSSDGSPHARPIKKHELRAELEHLQNAGYHPVGVTNASEDVKQIAAALQLPSFINTRLAPVMQHKQEEEEEAVAAFEQQQQHQPAEPMESVSMEPTGSISALDAEPMVLTGSVRSGQQVFAQNKSLVVLGNVSSGAEVMADGDVYVMGSLKGRALAGIGGNVGARIVCQRFDAELISIAHHFTTCDDLESLGLGQLHRATSVSLRDDQLYFEST